MSYQDRVKALWRRFGQETDTSIALQELDYASQEKATLHAFKAAVEEELHLKCAERGCKTLEMAVEMAEIQERYPQRAVQAVRTEESEVTRHLKAMGECLETLLGEIRDDHEQRKQWAARRESTRRRKADMECHTCHENGHFAREGPTRTKERSSGNRQSPPSQ